MMLPNENTPCEKEAAVYDVARHKWLDAKRNGERNRAAFLAIDLDDASEALEECLEGRQQ